MAKRILLVDDDRDFVESNRDLLEAYDYEVLAEYDGASGFETAKRERPDLMVLDVMMAHATEGFEVARKVQDTPELQGMRILLVSGITKDMNLSFKVNADQTWLPVDRILEKPIDPERFINEIEKALEQEIKRET